MSNIIGKVFQKNLIVKPLAVITSAAPPLAYIFSGTANLFMSEPLPDNPDMVAVSTDLIASFQGSLVLLVLMMSVINIYKPSKVVVAALLIGGMSLLAANLLQTIGITFLTFGLGLLVNSITMNKLITRNDALSTQRISNDVDKIIREARQ